MIRSIFYYGFTVTQANNKIDFNEGSGEVQATMVVGLYSLTTFMAEVARAMNAAGSQSYTVSINRATRLITISATTSFELLAGSGSRVGEGPWQLLGLVVDKFGTSILMNTPAGSSFTPQFPLQDYVAPENYQEYLKAVVNESAFGDVEVVRFGQVKYTQFNIRFQTNKTQGAGSPIETDSQGLDHLRHFMVFATTKGLVEFMYDRTDTNNFKTIRVESTELSSQGTGFQLKENYDKGLPHYFDSGILKWRIL